MTTLTVTSKGQITLRKELLNHLGLGVGDKVDIKALPGGRIELRASRRKGEISDVFDMFKREGGPSLTIEEINEITARGWAGNL